jgi:hypothetical protein
MKKNILLLLAAVFSFNVAGFAADQADTTKKPVVVTEEQVEEEQVEETVSTKLVS